MAFQIECSVDRKFHSNIKISSVFLFRSLQLYKFTRERDKQDAHFFSLIYSN
jgi:hypothetical protein